jgi:uncharacterized protein YkwD
MESKMQKQLHTFIMGGFTLFTIYLYSLSATPAPPKLTIKETPKIDIATQEEKALKYLNQLRVGAGLIPFETQPQLKKAAKNHANYLTNHLTFGHKEEAKAKDFTGEYASSRVIHVGYTAPQVIENVSTNNPNYKESINGLFAAIYHRLAFLDFRADTIGIGISQNPYRKSHTAFVYDMSSKGLEKLYQNRANVNDANLNRVLNNTKKLNNELVIYPFNNETEVPPAFFDELPDPLPNHKVSGFPISLSFNSLYHKEAKLLTFELYDNEGKKIDETVVFDQKSDPNRRLTKLDFVLFPLKRLKWNTQYHLKFAAMVDNKLVKKEWRFTTQTFKIPLHTVKEKNALYTIKEGESHIFYFPPSSKVDLLHDIAYPANIDLAFIDKNTIKLTALSRKKEKQKIMIGQHPIVLKIEKE